MTKPNFGNISAADALNHPDLPEANAMADAFAGLVKGMKWIERDVYGLAYAFYAGVEWADLSDRERKAFLIWQESIKE